MDHRRRNHRVKRNPNEEIEKVTLSLVREYLVRKDYFQTLLALTTETREINHDDEEDEAGDNNEDDGLLYTSRCKLGEDLKLIPLMRLNKKLEKTKRLKSMLEVLIKNHIVEKVYTNNNNKRKRTNFCDRSSSPIAIDARNVVDVSICTDYVETKNAGTMAELNDSPNKSVRLHYGEQPMELTPPRSSSGIDEKLKNENELIVVHLAKNNDDDSIGSVDTVPTNRSRGRFQITKVPAEKLIDLTTITHSNDSVEHRSTAFFNNEKSIRKETMNPFLSYNGTQIELTLENVAKLKEQQFPEKSPIRVSSLRSSLSEDRLGSEEDNNDGYPPPYSTPMDINSSHSPTNKQPQHLPSPSALFAKIGRNNSTGGLFCGLGSTGGLNEGGAAVSSVPSALETKQNLLAEATLSAEENEIRQLVVAKARNSFEEPSMMLQDIEDEDNWNSSTSASGPVIMHSPVEKVPANMLHFQKSAPVDQSTPQCIVKTLDGRTWQHLKTTIFGPKGAGQLLEGWIGQGFSFNMKIPYALVQRKGGPCGVLAVVQSLILKNLLFGSEYFDDDDDGSSSFGRPLRMVNLEDPPTITTLSSKRMTALIGAITEILWKCALQSSPTQAVVCVTGSFNITAPAPETYTFSSLGELKKYVRFNIHRVDCISLLYSVVLTRGIDRVQTDMDFPNSPLLGQHGYCTQELVNLLTIGTAISNAFDNEVRLGEKVLKGISAEADIGLLSLFEHYNSCQIGKYLKNPKYPIWIICSESHFSVLFSNDVNLALVPSDKKVFNLYYYDGLARQDQLIKLTIDLGGYEQSRSLAYNSPYNNNAFGINASCGGGDDGDRAPPLEKCIRTKWHNAYVNWNETEPIL